MAPPGAVLCDRAGSSGGLPKGLDVECESPTNSVVHGLCRTIPKTLFGWHTLGVAMESGMWEPVRIGA
jgi:hypothetical protein